MNVNEFMVKSGCDMTSRCYEYLPIALEIAIENPDMSLGMVLTNTAKERGKTYSAISKGLERLIVEGYKNIDADIKEKLFDNRESVTTGKYIRAVSYAIRNGII